MFILLEKAGKKFQPVSGKFQYGQVSHAKRRAEKDYGGKLSWGTHDDQWAGMDKVGKTWYHIIVESSNPCPKKNPNRDWVVFQYDPRNNRVAFLHASNQWTNRKIAVKFTTKKQAVGIARSAKHIKPYRIGVIRSDITSRELCRDLKKRLGGKVKRRRNPVGPTQREVNQAGELFKEFTGDHPETLRKVRIRNPKTGLVIGDLDGVLYTTKRNGKTERYKHDFKKGSRPLLVSSHDGQSLHILGGDYEFTERGIEG